MYLSFLFLQITTHMQLFTVTGFMNPIIFCLLTVVIAVKSFFQPAFFIHQSLLSVEPVHSFVLHSIATMEHILESFL